MLGRRNWDYVTFADYESDMRASTATTSSALELLRKRSEQAEKMVAYLVLAVGGKISLMPHHMFDPRVELTISSNPQTGGVDLTARRTDPQ